MNSPKYAFVSYVDHNYIDGFMTLLSSVVLNNLDVEYDFVVLYDDLSLFDRNQIALRYERVVFRKIDPFPYQKFKKGLSSNYLAVKAYYILEAFKLVDYDSIVCLDTDMVVLKPISELFFLEHPFAACPQYFNAQEGKNINSGLLVISKPTLSVETWQALCGIGESGAYELEKHDQAILSEYFNGQYHQLHHAYNTVKRRLLKKSVPASVKILHFTGLIKPWVSAESGYETLQKTWHLYNLTDQQYFSKLITKAIKAGNNEMVVFAARKYIKLFGTNSKIALDAFPGFRGLHLWNEAKSLIQAIAIHPDAADYPRYLRYLGEIHTALGESAGTGAMYFAASLHSGQPVLGPLANALWLAKRSEPANLAAELNFINNPASRANRVLKRKASLSKDLEQAALKALENENALSHAAFYMTRQGNAGDILLPWSVRSAIETSFGSTAWLPIHVHQRVSTESVEEINRTRGLIIGGGGLFIADTAANQVSGWQWNIDSQRLDSITVPINVFGVGYNQFYGHGKLSNLFAENISLLLEKSSFFGLRNSGSIEELKSYVSPSLAAKIAYQPCPTTVIKKTHETLFSENLRKSYIALNIALDRPRLRFGENYDKFLAQMATYLREISSETEVIYFAHAMVDEQFLIDLAKFEGISLRSVRLFDFDEEQIVQLYQEPQLVIGMRGHAGMIPFGCGTPIISLVTHPKLRYFLEDIEMNECAIEVNNEFVEPLLTQTRQILTKHNTYVGRIDKAIQRLWNTTQHNVQKIHTCLIK